MLQYTDVQDPRNQKRWYTEQTWLMRIGRAVAAPMLRQATEVSIQGLENVLSTGPFILASNHVTMMDSLYLCSLLPRYPYFMAKSELFKNPTMALGMRYAGAFPVHRGQGDQWAMRQAMRILEAGKVLGIYPEGTRSHVRGALGKGKTGTVRIALSQKVPIVPVAMNGTSDIFRTSKSLPRLAHVQINIGAPLDVSSYVSEKTVSYEMICDLTTDLMKCIAGMLPPEKRGFYASTNIAA